MSERAFRGAAGEVVRGFLGPGTWLTALPVLVASVLVLAAAGLLAERLELSPLLVAPLALAALSPIVGAFAMAGRAGATHAGVLDAMTGPGGRQVAGFAVRHALVSAAWCVPLMVAGRHVVADLPALVLAAPGSGHVLAAWKLMALAAFAAVAPTLGLLAATRADSVGELFSGAVWRWLLGARRGDIVPCMAACVGGMALFVLASVPVVALLVPVAASASADAGRLALTVLPALPFAAAPILAGRLAGAFVAAEDVEASVTAPSPRRPDAPLAAGRPAQAGARTLGPLAGQVRGTLSRLAESPQAALGTRAMAGVPLGVALARAHQTTETDPVAGAAALEALRAEHPRNPAVAAELARAMRKLGRHEDARATAAEAIRLALAGGAAPIAHDVFMAFSAEAGELALEPAAYEQIGRILLTRKELEGAAWCFRAAASLGGDPRSAQKAYLSACEAALHADDAPRALRLYEGFAETWPDSPMLAFARDGAELARRRCLTHA